MRSLLFVFLLSFFTIAVAQDYNLNQLQGSWWSNEKDPVAAFAIKGNVMFGDWEYKAHCKIKGDILYVDYGSEYGIMKHKIISAGKGKLILQDLTAPYETNIYFAD